jgi:preprotein translocase subunit YajC
MKIRLLSSIAFILVLTASACAQDANPAPVAGQSPSQGSGAGQGQRGSRGPWGGGPGLGGGRGLTGTVSEVAADHYTIKTDAGESYTVHFSANTHIMKQMVQRRGRGESDNAPANSPQMLKPSDIKVGDVVVAMGDVDTNAKSVGAVAVLQIDPERARQMREMQANYGKTWLMGKVTAINETKVTLQGSVDNAAHAFLADENTTFRKRRDPITLADVQLGDMVRVEGVVKDGIFVAASVSVLAMPPGGTTTLPRTSAPGAGSSEPNH